MLHFHYVLFSPFSRLHVFLLPFLYLFLFFLVIDNLCFMLYELLLLKGSPVLELKVLYKTSKAGGGLPLIVFIAIVVQQDLSIRTLWIKDTSILGMFSHPATVHYCITYYYLTSELRTPLYQEQLLKSPVGVLYKRFQWIFWYREGIHCSVGPGKG